MTQKSCTVGMCNATLRNHLKIDINLKWFCGISSSKVLPLTLRDATLQKQANNLSLSPNKAYIDKF